MRLKSKQSGGAGERACASAVAGKLASASAMIARFFIVACPSPSPAHELPQMAVSRPRSVPPIFRSLSRRLTCLFLLAGFHAHVVFGLTCLRGIVFRAGLLLIPTLLAGVRLFSSCCRSDAANADQHKDHGSDSWHDDLLSIRHH